MNRASSLFVKILMPNAIFKTNSRLLTSTTGVKTRNKTDVLSEFISTCKQDCIPAKVVSRSKRMVLDTLGVGILGAQSEVSRSVRQWAQLHILENNSILCSLWGIDNLRANPSMASFLNGVSVHSMDYDDTWHPATHPSGPVVATLLPLSQYYGEDKTLADFLTAFVVGIEVQGYLLRNSSIARHIPTKFHPPGVVGVMGSAAAASHFLGLSREKCRHALAIATSFAGSPMANAGTKTKPLHTGKSAMAGLEAASLAANGIEGNRNILDEPSGFGVFFDDYHTDNHTKSPIDEFVLNTQDVAIKRFPTHLGTHFGIDAALQSRKEHNYDVEQIERIVINAPSSKYINRRFPITEYDARHSLQFNVCSALLDRNISIQSYETDQLCRQELLSLLDKTDIHTPPDNVPGFDEMYVSVTVELDDKSVVSNRCNTPYGHWRDPLTDSDVKKKFLQNTSSIDKHTQNLIIEAVNKLDRNDLSASTLHKLL